MQRWSSVAMIFAVVSAGCHSDDAALDAEAGSDSGGPAATGLLGCPVDTRCTVVAVSQTVDDRVELFSAPGSGSGPVYRGALMLDLEPNPGGDITGAKLDEPYGLAWADDGLQVLLSHYPSVDEGSLLRVPATSVAAVPAGGRFPLEAWFSVDPDSGEASVGAGLSLAPLGAMEPLALLAHTEAGVRTGDLLIGVFANDLFVPEGAWVNGSSILAVRPGEALRSTALPCDGAWGLTALDDEGEFVALACDGDEAVVILDVRGVGGAGRGSPSVVCTGDIPFSAKRVRHLAPDGLGGVVVGETPPGFSTTEDARLWWFDASCGLRGWSVLEGESSWAIRELRLLPPSPGDGDADPRWLMARTDGDQRGVVVLAGDLSGGSGSGEIELCGRLGALDDAGAWTASAGGQPLRPHALALAPDGGGLAVGVGPAEYPSAGPGYGSVWWVELPEVADPCTLEGSSAIELTASAPPVDPADPETWRRAPDVVHVFEIEG